MAQSAIVKLEKGLIKVGKKTLAKVSSIAEAQGFLKGKFGSRFKSAVKKASNPLATYRIQKVIGSNGLSGTRILAGGGVTVWGKWSAKRGQDALVQHGLPPGKFVQEFRKKRKKNVASGKTIGTGRTRVFHPFRSSPDYDPEFLSGPEGQRARTRKASRSKARKGTGKKTTKKTRKASKKSNPKLHHARKMYRYTIQDASSATRVTDSLAVAKRLFASMKKRKPHEYINLYDNETGTFIADYKPKSNPKKPKKMKSATKRKVPAAFKAAAERAKAMTPAQRAAWAKKMQAARKAAAKRKGRP